MKNKAYFEDREQTLNNRKMLFNDPNKLLWYKRLYFSIFNNYIPLNGKAILEIGSGSSPLKHFYPEVKTSDIIEMDYLDLVFDCQKIDEIREIPPESLDVITMTNVLHHVEKPIDFLRKASRKLRPGGDIILAEPFFSWVSTPIYKYIHHEYCSSDLSEPSLKNPEGPLRSANIILPYLIFFSNKGWDSGLRNIYRFSKKEVLHYSSLSYFITGGFCIKVPIPTFLYSMILRVDCLLTRLFPQIFSSFFVIKLTRTHE